jgi:hypothetical protein
LPMPTDEAPDAISLSVIGEKTALGPLRQDIVATIARWLDPETIRTLEISPLP